MVVYRIIEDVYKYRKNNTKRNEYRDYCNGIISFPAKKVNHNINNHDYNPNINYIHFFHFYEDAIEYVINNDYLNFEDCYIAEYDIPKELLEEYIGFGYYPNNKNSDIPVLEYAIAYNELENSFINGIIKEYSYDNKYTKEYNNYISEGYKVMKKKIKR